MPVEAHRLVLREHQDLAQAAVEAVGEREIDDPISPAERDRRLGPVARQRLQPRAFAAGQNDGQHVADWYDSPFSLKYIHTPPLRLTATNRQRVHCIGAARACVERSGG